VLLKLGVGISVNGYLKLYCIQDVMDVMGWGQSWALSKVWG